ncbi:carbon-nitrogen family hydrolase [Acetivibrio mesophilus]|uniref:Carbon-nitrogen family hydrolase n=1 Tax=Acetivibrio mesophilus TaxID=2487273 RepID=A0A4Q0I0Q3_9FIRM|nr:carbon-nitrogen family hydrolase [Acetivibrio mesophilus]ODM27093.1 acyltransferase [Clostridium sp. Bc-iso-3]RXE57663.1 carbon-nitrogen family hydrolase [Acetivibrio mesophilus]HHV30659.1 carbon-nitrogen family hydrolase [Clostridium sp.]
MRVALYQMEIAWEDKEKNFKKLEQVMEEVKKHGTDLLLLPEMSFTGFSMNIQLTKEDNEESKDRVRKMSKSHQISIGFGWVEAAKEKAENHYTLIDEKGDEISDYVKIHPFSIAHEEQYFLKGNKLSTCKVQGFGISSFICYDLRFPTIFQALGDETEIVIVAANWPKKRREHWKCLLQARAIENQVYVLGINCVGNMGGLEYSGDSCVINPNGDIIERIEGKEGVIYADIEHNVKDIRDNFPVRMDRRTEFYRSLF